MRFVRWPLPAVLGWALAWGVFAGLRAAGLHGLAALSVATVAGLVAAIAGSTPWRRVFIAAGFPLSALLLTVSAGLPGGGGLPPLAWLFPLALLLLLYPLNTWRDAPLYPTPEGALDGLAQAAPVPAQAHILDAGCGLGAGLLALHAQYPQARLLGVELSWPLVLACRWRCRFARVRRASMWVGSWRDLDLVYLFQRPETMKRAADKAMAEMAAGTWLVSLEFEVPGLEPAARLEPVSGKPVWVYRMPGAGRWAN